MPSPALHLPLAEARRLHRRLTLLDQPRATIAEALAHHGYIQIDPINVCGRMHDLILRNRVAGYREGDLMRHLHGEREPLPPAARQAFEHHHPGTHILVAFGLEAWPYLHAAMKQRTRTASAWSGRLTPREKALAKDIFAELSLGRGPLNSDHIDDARQGKRVWGNTSLAKSTLQKLFFHGELLIAKREGTRRFYDRPERVLPAAILGQAQADAEDIARWQILLRLRQHRLSPLAKKELPLVADLVQELKVDSAPSLYCLKEDLPALQALREEAPTRKKGSILFLAPLDPLIYNRRVTRTLWAFDYTWEVYVPEAKRVRGYYALPVLQGTDLIGHVEPRIDREAEQLLVISSQIAGDKDLSKPLAELSQFLIDN